MLRPRRFTQIPLRYRSSSPPKTLQSNGQRKRRRTDLAGAGRSDVDQALAPIAVAPEFSDEPPTFVRTELPQFEANCVGNRQGASKYVGLSLIAILQGANVKEYPKKERLGRISRWRPTMASNDTILHGSHTQNQCSKCQIFLCREGPCW
jgi:hypothetical protein